MELAYHIRNREQLNPLLERRKDFHPPPCLPSGQIPSINEVASERNFITVFSQFISRIYVGDEFCAHRLQTPMQLSEIHRLASEMEMPLTLLTPPLTDDGLDRLSDLLAVLKNGSGENEIIVNDWGTARFVRQNDSGITIGAGRLLNKGFKDPRLPDPQAFREISDNARTLLGTGTFDHPGFDTLLTSFGIDRMERDLFPFADGLETPRFPTSLYLPYGYITTGRFCRIASFQKNKPKFAALSACGQPCRKISLKHTNPDSQLPLIQSGNTVFYQYSADMMNAIPHAPSLRLVYQGDAI